MSCSSAEYGAGAHERTVRKGTKAVIEGGCWRKVVVVACGHENHYHLPPTTQTSHNLFQGVFFSIPSLKLFHSINVITARHWKELFSRHPLSLGHTVMRCNLSRNNDDIQWSHVASNLEVHFHIGKCTRPYVITTRPSTHRNAEGKGRVPHTRAGGDQKLLHISRAEEQRTAYSVH